MPVNKIRLNYVDAAKGIALLLVMLGHTEGDWDGHNGGGWLVAWIDNMLLPVFWVAAGYTQREQFSLRAKFRRLMIPYLIMAAITTLFTLLANRAAFSWQSLAGLIYSRNQIYAPSCPVADHLVLLRYSGNSVLWFLSSLFTAFCVYRLILTGRSERQRNLLALISLAVAWAMTMLPILLPWSLDTAFFFAPLMWWGNRLRRYHVAEHGKWWWMVAAVAVYAVCQILTGATNYSIRDYGASMWGALGCSLCGTAVWLRAAYCLRHTVINNRARAFNAQALWIFGLQLMFMNIAERLCGHFAAPGWAAVMAEMVVASAGGWLTGRLMTRLWR